MNLRREDLGLTEVCGGLKWGSVMLLARRLEFDFGRGRSRGFVLCRLRPFATMSRQPLVNAKIATRDMARLSKNYTSPSSAETDRTHKPLFYLTDRVDGTQLAKDKLQ